MAAFDYTRTAATADRLIRRFGGELWLTRSVSGTYNPASSSAAETEHNFPVTGVQLDYQQKDIDGTLIRAGDKRVFISPSSDVTPRTGDTINIDGCCWNVVASRPLKPSQTVVLHDVQIRR